ncbi:MAG TPA: glycosyltransferase [Opitutaceae bacterium]|nr:glycosyltransferase [Opitutaceae bacterium]
MATVRVYLLTFRRPQLLRRALRSLLQQSLRDWTCELHNDAPEDEAPRAVLAELAPGDPRIQYHRHSRNWGPVAAFNHAFAGGPEEFASILEDDNWWRPEFLACALTSLQRQPAAALAWTNMRLWREETTDRWIDTGRAIWPRAEAAAPVAEFRWPELLQAFDALHSNGAMVFRPRRFQPQTVPPATPLAIIEQVRERAATGPLLFLPELLANFAITRHTARSDDPRQWLQAKLLVAASFFQAVAVSDLDLVRIWETRRALRPRDTDLFFLLALALRNARLIRAARPADWSHFLLGAARHPRRLLRGLRFRRDHAEVWAWLRARTSAAPRLAAAASVLSKQGFSVGVA